ncbi:MAG: ParB/RepB/Spo0J family partition protein [Candidatus Spechtbacterales bacterium]
MKGLESLIPQKRNPYGEDAPTRDSVFMIDIDKIKPNPYQPRREFKKDELASLADSIKVYGILQPLIVSKVEREVPTGRLVEYELVAGERRLRAAQMVRLPQVPVIIRHAINSTQKLEVALIENLQRDDLSPVEEAEAYKRLRDEFGMTVQDIGRQVGKSRPYVANMMRILNLPEYLKDALLEEKINEGHTRPLLRLTHDPASERKLFDEIVQQRFTVRQAEARARELLAKSAVVREPGATTSLEGGKSIVDNDLLQLIDRFKNHHQLSRVKVKTEGRQARLAIGFSSKKDLTDWIERLLT